MVTFMNNLVTGTIAEFIDYALIAVMIMTVYYGFRVIFGPRRTGADPAPGGDASGLVDWFRGRSERSRQGKQVQARRGLLKPGRGFIMRAEQAADEARDQLRTRSAASLTAVNSRLDEIRRNLRDGKRIIRRARQNAEGDRRGYLGRLVAYVETIEEATARVESNLPASYTATDWTAKTAIAKVYCSQIMQRCGFLMDSMDKFVREDRLEDPASPGPHPLVS